MFCSALARFQQQFVAGATFLNNNTETELNNSHKLLCCSPTNISLDGEQRRAENSSASSADERLSSI